MMDGWNPMAEDYRNPTFNSYTRGPATGQGGTESMRPQRPKVHVSGLPLEMTGEGLSELFSQAASVVDAYVMQPKGGKNFKIGFVTLSTLSDMEKAISKMNGHQIKNYTLRVSPAREKQTDMRSDFGQGRERMYPRPSGGGDSRMNAGPPSITGGESSMERDGNRAQETDGRGSDTPQQRDSTPQRGTSLSPMTGMMAAGCEECQQLLMALMTHMQQNHSGSQGAGGSASNAASPTKPATPDSVKHNLLNGSGSGSRRTSGEAERVESKGGQGGSNGSTRSPRPQQGGDSLRSPMTDGRPERSPRQSPGRQGNNRNQGQKSFQQSTKGSAFSKPHPIPREQDEQQAASSPPQGNDSPNKMQQLQKDASDIKPCEACGKAGNKHCSQCHVTYCSVQCQKGDWKKHKNKCKPTQRSDQTDGDTASSNLLWAEDLVQPTPPKKEIRVMITHINHPGSFWMQLAETSFIQQYKRVVDLINVQVKQSAPLQNVQENMLCLAQYSEDGGWYRAKVLQPSSGGNKIMVSLIDFGNTDEVALENLRPATPEIMQIPLVVVQGSLADVEPRGSSGKWSAESCRLLEELSQSRLAARFVGHCAGMHQVQLKCEDDGESVADNMIKKEMAWPKDSQRKVLLMSSLKQTELPATDGPVRIMINHFVGPREFYFTLVTKDSEKEADQLAQSLAKSLTSSQDKSSFKPQIGEVCAGKFTDDDAWYRAHVESQNASGGFNVQYIDFGNMETVPVARLRPLPDQFHDIPQKSFRASFADLAEGDLSTDGVQQTMQLLSLCMNPDNTFQATLHGRDGATVLVKIANPKTGQDVAQEAGLTSKTAAAHRAADVPFQDIPVNQELSFVVTAVNSPAEFFALWQNPENEKRMVEITTGVKEIGSQPEEPTLNPKTGDLVCAQFSGDKEWYRAAVLKEYPNKEYDVQYIDFGNGERVPVSMMRPITDELAAITRVCISCSLATLPSYKGPWTSEVLQSLKDMVGEATKTVIARVRETRNHVAYTELEDTSTGLDITQEIIHLIMETESVKSGPSSLSSNPGLAPTVPAQPQTQTQAQDQPKSDPGAQTRTQAQSQPQSAPAAVDPDELRIMREQMALLQARLSSLSP